MDQALRSYDRSQTYRWNYEAAPDRPLNVDVPAVAGTWTFCGRPVPSPLGIAAGPLLNGRWVLYYAALGFDVLTYKTTRSVHRECYPLPNLLPVQTVPLSKSGVAVDVADEMDDSWAISFGMPSMSPDIWRADVEWTRNRLPKQKLLSVSVVATAQPDWSNDDLANDFAQCARWAVESGADCVEANFSCPNVTTVDGQLYQQPTLAAEVAHRIRESVGAAFLLIKLGFVPDEIRTAELVDALAPFVDAFVMTNCISAVVHGPNDQALFHGETRGIGGAAIRNASIAQIRRFSSVLSARGLATKVIGVGGISNSSHVREYLEAGSEAVQLATSAMIDPHVGCQIRGAGLR